ncbi:dimethyl sulfoxide reductase anchor subunit family protein [Cytobacillus gottheilii]|uniref:dimethyl sulfoxide reductase anchor subunit family protein n=1 Tax=Cytobacillus gottheilii TaxID=859144 RepID=UPI003CF54AD2
MHEWSLLIFTLCMQAAIGGTVMLLIFYKKLSKLDREQQFQLMRLPLVVIAGLSLIGLAASFTHLGSPENALNTIRHLGSSWMSREILVTGMFIAVACGAAGLAFIQKKVNVWLLAAGAVIGLFDIYCMGAIYYNTLVSGWNSINTYTSFYGTAFVLGPILIVSLLVPFLKAKNEELAQAFVKNAFYIALGGIAIQLIGVAIFGITAPEVNQIAGVNVMDALEGYQTTVAIRWMIEIIGIFFIGYLSIAMNKKIPFYFAYGALAVLLLAEGMSRYVFYVMGA